MTTTKRGGIRALFALLLLLLLPMGAAADEGIKQGSTISGTVRVYLSSIGSNASVDLTVDGSYSIGGDTSRAIARGTQLNVRNSGGSLTLTMNGQERNMGARFKLRRHQTSGNNGVRIQQARKPQNLYPGDIEFIVKGGNVQIVVHVYMEDYMRGVLPYELDNSFPLEALKAQAVAARTYALKKMSAQAATYDLVDTTSDQVYNGTPAGNERCVQAVQETSGIVGTVSGDYMASYYTASNGGQTESVQNAWGSGSYSYLQIKDDPYDLRNGASIAKSVTFYRNGTTSVPALTELLRTEASMQTGLYDVNIQSIDYVNAHTPKYAEPSRVYTKVTVGMTLAGYGQTAVTLDYFNQIESLCAMSINVLKNETLAVTDTDSGFKLTARRFGHGVGMSQRGAQQMASEGFTYDQILDFYYPGIVRTRYTMTRTLLPSMDGTSDVPQEPTVDAKMAVVTLLNPLDSLNLRKEASTASAILAQMPHGTQVTLLESGSAWSRVQYGTLSGYVKNEFLSVTDDAEESAPPAAGGKGTATVALSDESQILNLRAAPTTGSAIVARLRHGTVMTVLERYESWTYVRHGAQSGYVMNDYIVYDAQGTVTPGATPAPTARPAEPGDTAIATVVLQSSDSRLNLREGKSLAANVLLRLVPGTKVTVTEWGEEWCAVTYGGVSGYCSTDYLRFEGAGSAEGGASGGSASGNGSANGNGGAQSGGQATPVPGIKMAIVLPENGLNLRMAASLSSGVIMALGQGTTLTVMGEEVGGMLPVRLGSIDGFVASEYVYVVEKEMLVPQTPAPTATPTPTKAPEPTQPPLVEYITPAPQPGSGSRVMVNSDNGLNLRAQPTTGSQVLYVLPYGMVLTVLGEGENGFLHVQWANYTGYVSKDYVTPFGGS